jgi:hypothetical protein
MIKKTNGRGTVVGARVNDALEDRLRKATDRSRYPFAPTTSQVIIRGIALALDELDRERKGK